MTRAKSTEEPASESLVSDLSAHRANEIGGEFEQPQVGVEPKHGDALWMCDSNPRRDPVWS